MSQLRGDVLDWFAARRVAPGRELEVLRAAAMIPAPAQWRVFLGQLALWLGTVALAAAVIFFFAFNWDDLGRLAKFGLVEAAILAALVAYWRIDLDGMAGKAVLTLMSLLVGALLALAGQVYQTGADTFELFSYWAALILPWVLIGCFAPLWLIWLGLVNIALFLYFSLGRSSETLLWALFLVNSVALILSEAARRAGLPWLHESWPPRLIAIANAATATGLIVWAIFAGKGGSTLFETLAYAAWLAGLYVWYRRFRPDLFMLAAGLLSLIIAVAAILSRHMLDLGGGAYLFIGLVVIGTSAAGAIWLKSIAQEQPA
ncbi:DUF2157 domain-containing protein [Sphingomonas sp. 37zxx]|uniref:DUF2157 domain-containing protein n=1 Tax=Sphingomonas sp. 37zxx TaxID=1550073 RepID=UPI00053C03E8|nr:DUF2157 domain-containing protein [Sphingomonas sp. 37zxx]